VESLREEGFLQLPESVSRSVKKLYFYNSADRQDRDSVLAAGGTHGIPGTEFEVSRPRLKRRGMVNRLMKVLGF